jgi:hypothetical protein
MTDLSNSKFVGTHDNGTDAAGLMFCVPLGEDLMERSSVLQVLQEASPACSLAQLPGEIRRPDFLLWAFTNPQGPGGKALSCEELVTVLKVPISIPLLHQNLLSSSATR